MTENERYLMMVEKLSQKHAAIALIIVNQKCGLVECSNAVQQFLYFGKGCAYVCRCFGEITGAQYHDLKNMILDSVRQLNELICRTILHEDVSEAGI